MIDGLTGISHRMAFHQQMEVALLAKTRLLVIIADIDGRKAVNDSFGHEFGNDVLCMVAHAFAKRFGTRCCRFGGEQFAAFCECSDWAQGLILTTTIEAEVANLSFEERAGFAVAISVGTATFPDEASTVNDLLRCADDSVYHGRRERRTRPTN
ncbi:MAG TPA: GGDEF domain-containing protein [Candidatus Sulfotelmatobacter sp.]|nr:GGDEF domain-containing protein [Candidatus Sulfotelmatobacter sp.]